MSLIWSRQVAGPAAHALIIGVSDYAHLPRPMASGPARTLGLTKLRSPALSAWRFHEFLLDAKDELARPLASIRLLCSPSSAEAQAEPALAGAGLQRPTFANVKEAAWAWRNDLVRDEDLAILYFCGHGLQADRDGAILLFDDFAAPDDTLLARAVRLSDIRFGMAPSEDFPAIAQTQFYFIDACRDDPTKDTAYAAAKPGIFFDNLNSGDVDYGFSFHATRFGKRADGVAGETSFYTRALINALNQSCYQSERSGPHLRWPVTAFALQEGILLSLEELGRPKNAILSAEASGNAALRYLPGPPSIDVTIEVKPGEKIAATQLELRNPKTAPIAFPGANTPHPYRTIVPSGLYWIYAKHASATEVEGDPDWVTFKSRHLAVEIP